ncbi:MAG: hypothetical protein OIF50_03895 [Flavobacteriaceae bacterium]|nr:hypothetical protein [Flavobacteriaceae bacterium]
MSENNKKYQKLFFSILLDGVGYLSFLVPALGETSDIIWAPISAYLMTRMYKGMTGKIAGAVTFLEEIAFFTDFIPTFTLTWIYEFLVAPKAKKLPVVEK